MEQAFRLQRVLLADGEPIGLQSGFYPQTMLASGDGLWTPENLSTCSLYSLFEKTLRLQLWRAEETLEPAIAESKEVELLKVPAGAPVLVVRRLSFLESGEPIETVKLVFGATSTDTESTCCVASANERLVSHPSFKMMRQCARRIESCPETKENGSSTF